MLRLPPPHCSLSLNRYRNKHCCLISEENIPVCGNKSSLPLSETVQNVLAGVPLRYAKERSAFLQRNPHSCEETDAHAYMRAHIPKRYDLDFAVSLTGSKYLELSNLTNNARVLAANAPIKGKKHEGVFHSTAQP